MLPVYFLRITEATHWQGQVMWRKYVKVREPTSTPTYLLLAVAVVDPVWYAGWRSSLGDGIVKRLLCMKLRWRLYIWFWSVLLEKNYRQPEKETNEPKLGPTNTLCPQHPDMWSSSTTAYYKPALASPSQPQITNCWKYNFLIFYGL